MFFNVFDVFSFSCFQRSACFPYVIPSAIFTRYFINAGVFSSVGGLCFTEGNSCSRVLRVLLQTFILCFLRVLDRGSVIPLIYGSVAYPAQGFEGSISSKNVLTNSSGLGVAFSVWVLITLEIIVFGYEGWAYVL